MGGSYLQAMTPLALFWYGFALAGSVVVVGLAGLLVWLLARLVVAYVEGLR